MSTHQIIKINFDPDDIKYDIKIRKDYHSCYNDEYEITVTAMYGGVHTREKTFHGTGYSNITDFMKSSYFSIYKVEAYETLRNEMLTVIHNI